MTLSETLTTYIKPVVLMIIIVSVAVWIGYCFYWVFKKTARFRLKVKYDWFKKEIKEETIVWCNEAYDMKLSVEDVQTRLLLAGNSHKATNEICYIYEQIVKLKGGLLKKDEQGTRKSAIKTFPKIEREGESGSRRG